MKHLTAIECAQKGIESSKTGDSNRAIAYYRQAIFLDDNQPLYIYEGLANQLLQNNQIPEARQTFNKLIRKYPNQPQGFVGLARIAQHQQQWERALKLWNNCFTKFPQLASSQWYSSKAYTLLELGRLAKAEQQFFNLNETHPEQLDGLVGLAQVAQCQQDLELALARWKNVIVTFPNYVDAYVQYCAINLQLERFQETKVFFEEMAKQQSDLPLSLDELMRLAQNKNEERLGKTNSMKLFQYSQKNRTPLRVCIINFTGERKNWGCQATSWELVRILNRLWPQPQTFILKVIPLLPHHALDQDITTDYGNEIRAAFANPNPTDDQKEHLKEISRKRYFHYVDMLEQADLVLFQAEGTMTGTDFLRAERLLLLPWLAAHVFNKPVISLNQTVFSANNDFSQILFTVLDSFSQVWVRELASYKWLQDNNFKNVRLVPDTAFLTDPLDHGRLWKVIEGKDYFCVTGSAALFQDDIPNYLKAIRSIAEATGLFPVFLCSTGRDLLLLKYAKENWPEGSFGQVNRNLIYPAVAHCLGQAHFLVGGRYHLSILAAINGTPTVLIRTNTHKLNGLVEMLKVNWPIREISQQELLVADACQCLEQLESSRLSLKLQVVKLRADIITAFQDCPEPKIEGFKPRQKLILIPPAEQEVYLTINQQIASHFKYPKKDTPQAKLGAPPEILPQLITLTVYLRRNKYSEATFCCLRQLVEGNLNLVLNQLNSRWLVSICDSYADFGKPIEARNALLISTFLNWERLAASYIHWSDPSRKTRRIDNPVDPKNQPLWDGLVTVQLTRGDTINNLLIRYAKLLEKTPHLLKIWRALLDRLQNNDSVMSALNAPHRHLFDENLDWMANEQLEGIPPWRI